MVQADSWVTRQPGHESHRSSLCLGDAFRLLAHEAEALCTWSSADDTCASNEGDDDGDDDRTHNEVDDASYGDVALTMWTEGYAPRAESWYPWEHIVEPHKRTYLAADGASTSDHSGFAWHVARLAHGGAVATPDEELMAERESGASVAEDRPNSERDSKLAASSLAVHSPVTSPGARKFHQRQAHASAVRPTRSA